jgi:hypothetical protein
MADEANDDGPDMAHSHWPNVMHTPKLRMTTPGSGRTKLFLDDIEVTANWPIPREGISVRREGSRNILTFSVRVSDVTMEASKKADDR